LGDPAAFPGHFAAVRDVFAAALGDSAAVLLLLKPLLASQAEALSTKLQAMFVARLEEVKELIHMDADEPLERASPSPWGEFLEELALGVSSSPQNAQLWEAAPSLLARRSSRSDNKNKDCDIPVTKRAEYRRRRLLERFQKSRAKGKSMKKS
jgi:hypothetical protein